MIHIISGSEYVVETIRSEFHTAIMVTNPRTNETNSADIFIKQNKGMFQVNIYINHALHRSYGAYLNKKANNGLTGMGYYFATVHNCMNQEVSHYTRKLIIQDVAKNRKPLLARMVTIVSMLTQELQGFDIVAPVADEFDAMHFTPFATPTKQHIRVMKTDYNNGLIVAICKRERVPKVTMELNNPHLGCTVDNVDWNQKYPELVIRMEK